VRDNFAIAMGGRKVLPYGFRQSPLLATLGLPVGVQLIRRYTMTNLSPWPIGSEGGCTGLKLQAYFRFTAPKYTLVDMQGIF
jgi:hypothetical protein